MKKVLALATLITSTLFIVSCSDDETPNLDSPTVSAPSSTSVQVGTDVTVDFTFTAAAGFVSSNVTAESGTASVTADASTGDVSGTISVTFTAGTTSGAGSVTLTVTDAEGDIGNATAVITISESDVPEISGIPASAEVEAEMTLGPVTATISMEDVPGTLSITKDGVAYGSDVDITADGQTYDFSYTPTIDEANTTIEFVFTVEDSDGDTDEVTHVLTVTAPDVETVVVTSNIEADATWETGKIYELAGRITVVSGVTLTIQPGVIVKGQAGAETNSKALLVARGATLNAVGTADAPIIFTSTDDEIIPGQIQSPNLDPDVAGLWGGVIILGNAQISASNDAGADVTEAQIEGIPTSDANGLYGGSDNTDNSGTIAYISIRHGGTDIGSGNEINGLTLGGVGSGTSISNVEVVANNDDGIEWFGGDVDMSNVMIWNCGDDGLDTDQDWIGTCSDFIIVTPLGGSGFELDGPEGTLNRGVHTFDNGIVYAGAAVDHLVDWDGSTNAELQDIYFFGLDADYGIVEDDPATTDVDEGFEPIESFGGDGAGTSSGWQVTPASGTSVADVFGTITIVTEVAENANTVGPTSTGFSWTWAAASGELSEIGID